MLNTGQEANRFGYHKPAGVIINFTPTGMIPSRAMSASVPLSVNEIIDDVLAAYNLGISMVHLHARDPITQLPSSDPEIYAQIILGIRAHAPELIICASTSGRTNHDLKERKAVLMLDPPARPDMASLTLSSLNFNNSASINSPEDIQELARTMLAQGIKPELEAFDAGMINYARYLIKKNLLQAPYYFNLIVGNIACAQADLLHVGVMIQDLPQPSFWSLGGIGDAQLPMHATALAMGAGVRVGLEDNLWYNPERTIPASNQALLQRIHRLRNELGKTMVSCSELRQELGLAKLSGNTTEMPR